MFCDNRRLKRTVSLWPALLTAIILVAAAGGDEVELDNGIVFKGKVLKQTPKLVVFEREGGKGTVRFLNNRIIRIEIDDEKSPQRDSPDAPAESTNETEPAPGAVAKKPSDAAGNSRASIEAIINEIGPTKPDWWDSVKLDYPKTLDLTGKVRSKEWQQHRIFGHYYWSIVYPNPPRWKPGIKLLHHAIDLRENDKPRQADAMDRLGGDYARLLKDYPRGAYWLSKALASKKKVYVADIVALAESYWKLGSRQMAIAELKRYGLDRRPRSQAIKLYSEMGMTAKALSLAEALSLAQARTRTSWPVGYLVTGNVHKRAGNDKEALACYSRVLNIVKNSPKPKKLKRLKERAQMNMEAVRAYMNLDITKVPDGTYTSSAMGFDEPIDVQVTVSDGKITSVEVTRDKESQPYRSLTDIPEQIVDTQSFRVDAVTKATITSNAVIAAAAKALAGAEH